MKRCFAALIALALLLSTVPALADDAPLKVTLNQGGFNLPYARNMLSLINDMRQSDEDAWYWNETDTQKIYLTGLQPLTYDYGLERVAMLRAAELAVNYSHTRPNGQTCFTAYPSSLLAACGENIAYGYRSTEAMFIGWAEEDEPYAGQGHRRNMLSGNYTTIGIGCYAVGGVLYWAQEFSSRKSGEADNPLTLPLTVETLTSSIKGLSAADDTIELELNESLPLNEIAIESTGVRNWYSTPCEIEGLTWASENAAIAAIVGDQLVGKAKGTTNLQGSVGSLSFAVPVKVSGPLPGMDVTVGGTQRLDPDGTEPNLSVTIPTVSGASSYTVALYNREARMTRTYNYSYANFTANYNLTMTDNTTPVHMTITVSAKDSGGEVLAKCVRSVVLYPMSGVLWLPRDIKTIDSNAFTGTAATATVLPDGAKAIGARAFSGCDRLCSVYIPASVTSIADDAFTGCAADLVICAPKDSKAAQFAKGKGIEWLEVE